MNLDMQFSSQPTDSRKAFLGNVTTHHYVGSGRDPPNVQENRNSNDGRRNIGSLSSPLGNGVLRIFFFFLRRAAFCSSVCDMCGFHWSAHLVATAPVDRQARLQGDLHADHGDQRPPCSEILELPAMSEAYCITERVCCRMQTG